MCHKAMHVSVVFIPLGNVKYINSFKFHNIIIAWIILFLLLTFDYKQKQLVTSNKVEVHLSASTGPKLVEGATNIRCVYVTS